MKWKFILKTLILSLVFISCAKTDELPSLITISNPQPGLAQIFIYPRNNQYADLVFNVFGGTPYSTIECRYAITDYMGNGSVVNFLPLFLYKQLDTNGTATIVVLNAQCSSGLATNQAFIEWGCRSTFSPYQESYTVNSLGNSFFFNCPAS